jgi:hypothetical protein
LHCDAHYHAAIQNAQILHEALTNSWGCTCVVPHKSSLRLNWQTANALSPTQFEMALSYASSPSNAQKEIWKRVDVVIEKENP